MERNRGKFFLLAIGAMLAAALSACQKEQQGGSVLDPDPGSYKGAKVTDLSPETLAALDKRAQRQEFYNVGGQQ